MTILTSRPVLIEAACSSVADCLAAEAAGANRAELCAALLVGGLTPSAGAIEAALARARLPIVCMVRPRAGGFCYSAGEIDEMHRDIVACRRAGAAGAVFGVLTTAADVDLEACRRLVEAAGPMETVFHRAFDLVADQDGALDALVGLGLTRVLTSGGRPTALEGAAVIRRLRGRAAGRIEILPGGGVRAGNAAEILAETGATSLHLGPSLFTVDPTGAINPNLAFGEPGAPAGSHRELDASAVRQVRDVVGGKGK